MADPLVQQQIIDAINNADYSEVVVKLIDSDPTLEAKVKGILHTAVFHLGQSAEKLELDSKKINKELSDNLIDTLTLNRNQKKQISEDYKKAIMTAVEKINFTGKIDLSGITNNNDTYTKLSEKLPEFNNLNKFVNKDAGRTEDVFESGPLKVIVEDWGDPAKKFLKSLLGGGGKLSSLTGKDKGADAGWWDEFIGGLLSGALVAMGLPKALAVFGPIAAIGGGLLWAAFDGIRGYWAAQKWGTDSVSAVIGAVLGGMDSGWKGAFKNMGKWALMGAGVGLISGGPIGALVGGIVGAAVGGILGYFGGERIAKALDSISTTIVEGDFIGEVSKLVTTGWFSKIPFIDQIVNLGKAIGAFVGGDWKAGLTYLGLAYIPGANLVLDLMGLSAEELATPEFRAMAGRVSKAVFEDITTGWISKIPFLDQIVNLGKSIGAFVGGDWKAGLTYLGLAYIPGANLVLDLLGTSAEELATPEFRELAGKNANSLMTKMKDSVLNGWISKIPGIDRIVNLGKAIGAFIDGDWKAGLTYLGLSYIPGANLILDILGTSADEMATPEGRKKVSNLRKNMINWMEKLPFIKPILNLIKASDAFADGNWKAGLTYLSSYIPGVGKLLKMADTDIDTVAANTESSGFKETYDNLTKDASMGMIEKLVPGAALGRKISKLFSKLFVHDKANDFIWRSGESPQVLPIDRKDNVIGEMAKAPSREDTPSFNNIGALDDTNLYLQQMKKGIDNMLVGLEVLIDTTKQTAIAVSNPGQGGEAYKGIEHGLETTRGFGGDQIHEYHLDVWKAIKG